jgi:hypothetical protein
MPSQPQIEELQQRRAALIERVQAMLQTPEDQRPAARTTLRAWLTDLEASQRLLEQVDKMLKMLEPKPKRSAKAAATPAPSADKPSEETDAVVLACIPKGRHAEMRIIAKTWKGRRLIDVRCWAQKKDTGEFGPTRKGVCVDAGMLPALVEALQRAQKNA